MTKIDKSFKSGTNLEMTVKFGGFLPLNPLPKSGLKESFSPVYPEFTSLLNSNSSEFSEIHGFSEIF